MHQFSNDIFPDKQRKQFGKISSLHKMTKECSVWTISLTLKFWRHNKGKTWYDFCCFIINCNCIIWHIYLPKMRKRKRKKLTRCICGYPMQSEACFNSVHHLSQFTNSVPCVNSELVSDK